MVARRKNVKCITEEREDHGRNVTMHGGKCSVDVVTAVKWKRYRRMRFTSPR